MKGEDLHPRLLYPAKLSFRMEGLMKCFPDKVKLRDFITTKPLLYEILRNVSKKNKIKNMNSKMTTNPQLSITEHKTKTNSKANNWNRNRITEREITWRVISGEGEGREWGKHTGNKKHNYSRYKIGGA